MCQRARSTANVVRELVTTGHNCREDGFKKLYRAQASLVNFHDPAILSTYPSTIRKLLGMNNADIIPVRFAKGGTLFVTSVFDYWIPRRVSIRLLLQWGASTGDLR